MSDNKDLPMTDELESGRGDEPRSSSSDRRLHVGDSNDNHGWQTYRKWISKAPVPKTQRNGIDPSLYTWKGYRSWSERVRRNWTPPKSGPAGFDKD